MNEHTFVKSMPGEDNHQFFQDLPNQLYPTDSPRFKLGHDPVLQHLEGCYTLLIEDKPVGRFALYENPDMRYLNETAISIGSYECVEDTDVSEVLLEHAKTLSRNKGYKWLIGPMEGSTWNSYRFSDDNDQPNFFMEPYHHAFYNEHFLNEDFGEIAHYYTNLVEALDFDIDKIIETEKHFKLQGASFRKLDMSDFNGDLKKIAKLSIEGFSDNFLYTPITVDEFVAKYEKLEHFFDPELVWILEDKEKEIHAFVFCMKDFFDPTGETLILKSIVRKRTSPFKEISAYLAPKTKSMAKNGGYTKIIHAMMISDNASLKFSNDQSSKSYKYYSLYGFKL